MMSKAERFWDGRADSFDGDGEGPAEADPRVLAAVIPHLKATDTVLDFGCATGTWSVALAGSVREVHGLDISDKMIEIARAKAAAQHVDNVRFGQGSTLDAQLTDQSFDVVLALNVLHLLPDAPQTMERLYGLLKPGGRFISETPCLGQSRSVMALFMRGVSKTGIVPHLGVLSSVDVEKLITKAGLNIIQTDIQSGSSANFFAVAEKQSTWR